MNQKNKKPFVLTVMSTICLLFVIVWASVFLYFICTGNYSYHELLESYFAESGNVLINYEDYPEGTDFVDILVKDKKNDKYAVEFNEKNAVFLNVAKDCGIARYDEDGYTSLMLRHSCANLGGVGKSDSSCFLSLTLNTGNFKLWRHFGRIKLAYCDKDGNVIGVTDDVKIEYDFFEAVSSLCFNVRWNRIQCDVNYVIENRKRRVVWK